MKVKSLAPSLMVGFTLLTAAISSYSCYESLIKSIDNAKMRELKSASEFIQFDLQREADKSAATATLVSQLPSVQDAFRTDSRTELTRQLENAFKTQRNKYGVSEAAFYKAPATAFFRLFDPTLFNDDVSSYREMVLTASQKQKPQQGLEVRRNGLSIRGIAVVKDAKGFIGTFESGSQFKPVLEHIKKVTGFDSGVFIDEDLMKKVAVNVAKPSADKIIGGYQNIEATNWNNISPVINPKLLTKLNDITYKLENKNGIEYGAVLIPLLDFKGAEIGSIVTVANFESYEKELSAGLTRVIAYGLLQAIILVGVLTIILRGFFLSPVRKLTEEVNKLTHDDTNFEIGSLAECQTEIGELARAVESLKKHTIDKKPKS